MLKMTSFDDIWSSNEEFAVTPKTSPILCTKAFAWSEEVIRGKRLGVDNPLRWDKVMMNLPGSKDYDPSLPWVYKYNSLTGTLAGYFGTYVDDIRPVGGTEKECRRIARRVASVANYLGQQDAPRERRRVSQTPGAWAGAIVLSKEGNLYVTTSQERWDKCKAFLTRWKSEAASTCTSVGLDHKDLQRGRGHLVYLCRTYPSVTPFLKGIHHTLESWRGGRDEEGWKFTTKKWQSFLKELGEDMKDDETWVDLKHRYMKKKGNTPPTCVKPVSRLIQDLTTLLFIMRSKSPPLRLVRGMCITQVRYGFGDAAGSGFGSSWEGYKGVRYRFGVWGSDKDEASSNRRELTNVVESLEQMGKEDNLQGMEIFFFTDNSTAERAFFKGSSTSAELHKLVIRLRDLEMNEGCIIRLCHVAGTRMIRQGSDGLSRGNLTEGVMAGQQITDFIPIHKNALERSDMLAGWLKSWGEAKGEKLEFLEPEDWFVRGHDIVGYSTNIDGLDEPIHKSGFFVWTPPPGAAEVALEEMRRARQKRTRSHFIFVCPRLLEPYWRGHVHKSADFVFEIPAGTSFWPEDMHEPLILAIYLPFLHREPWQFKGCAAVLGVVRNMQGMWKASEITQRVVLCKLWGLARKLEGLPTSMVQQMLRARSGIDIPYCPASK